LLLPVVYRPIWWGQPIQATNGQQAIWSEYVEAQQRTGPSAMNQLLVVAEEAGYAIGNQRIQID